MAVVRYPAGEQRSGSTGGVVYSRNRFGAYIRARSVPVNPNTDRQAQVRVVLRNLAIYWNSVLTQLQRDAWEVYASSTVWLNALGEECRLTGLNHYIRTNTAMAQAGGARLDAAPVIGGLAPAEWSLGGSASEATQDVSVTFDDADVWCDEDGAYQLVYVGIPKKASIKYFGGPYRFAGVIEGDSVSPPTSPEAIASPWPIAEGQRLWVRTRVLKSDGRLSEFALCNFLCSA